MEDLISSSHSLVSPILQLQFYQQPDKIRAPQADGSLSLFGTENSNPNLQGKGSKHFQEDHQFTKSNTKMILFHFQLLVPRPIYSGDGKNSIISQVIVQKTCYWCSALVFNTLSDCFTYPVVFRECSSKSIVFASFPVSWKYVSCAPQC